MKRDLSIAVVVAVAVIAIGPAAALGSVYGGSTSDQNPIAITLAKSGQLTKVAIDWTASCGSGQSYPFGEVLPASAKPPKFIPDGTSALFGAIHKGKLAAAALGSESLGDGMSARIAQQVSAKFKPTSASGTWSAHVDVLDDGGSKVDSCDTGKLRWSARRGPNVYGGSTTQGEPVVIRTNKSRSRVDYLGFGWSAGCTPDGFWRLAENFGNFPLTERGAFGDQWTDDHPLNDGSGKNSFGYAVGGTLGKRHGSGTFAVRVTSTDKSGATTSSCDSKTIRWSVTQ